MHPFMRVVAFATLLTKVVSMILQVNVGQQGIAFTPNTLQASVGDIIQFSFYNNHSVVESAFASPCQPLSNGFYSGFIESCLNCGAAPQQFNLNIKDTDPHWFYCSQKDHCARGMVGVINPLPSSSGQLGTYAAGAAKTNPNASSYDISPIIAPMGGIISSSATPSTPTSNPLPSKSFNLSASNSVNVPASAISHSYTSWTTTASERVVVYTPNNKTNSIITGANIIYEVGGATPAAITTIVKAAPSLTSPTFTVTSVMLFYYSVTSASSLSATNEPAMPVASPSSGSITYCMLKASGNGGLWLLAFSVLCVGISAAW